MLQKVNVTIEGISPLLMHRYPLEPVEALDKKAPAEQAEIAAYRNPESGKLYVQGYAVQRALVSGGTFSKGRGRASLQKQVAASILVTPEEIPLEPQEYIIDARPVVIPSTRGRIVRYRPRFEQWELRFNIEYENDLITEPQLKQIVIDTGTRVGLLDFRPEKKGMFGRFQISSWDADTE